MSKVLLIICGGIEAIPGIQLAKQMGLHVVVSDKDPNAPGFKYADDYIIASTYDVGETVTAALAYHNGVRAIDGVMCMAADVPLTVASVAEALNLPGINTASAKLATHKLKMKRAFSDKGVPIPWFSEINSCEQLDEIVASQGLPLIIKPTDSRGARGVLCLTKDLDRHWAFNYAKQHSPSGSVMVEKYLTGPQVSTESIIIDGQVFTPGFSDRNYEHLDKYAPHVIENGGNLPSILSKDIQAKIDPIIALAAKSIGIYNGVVKGDVVINNAEPYVIELAARLSGGYFCTHEIPLNTGVSTVKAVIKQSLGEKVEPNELAPKYSRAVSQRYLFPQPGRVVKISGVERARDILGVKAVVVKAKVGDIIKPPVDSNGWAGMVLAVGDDRSQVNQQVFEAINCIHITTEVV